MTIDPRSPVHHLCSNSTRALQEHQQRPELECDQYRVPVWRRGAPLFTVSGAGDSILIDPQGLFGALHGGVDGRGQR